MARLVYQGPACFETYMDFVNNVTHSTDAWIEYDHVAVQTDAQLQVRDCEACAAVSAGPRRPVAHEQYHDIQSNVTDQLLRHEHECRSTQ